MVAQTTNEELMSYPTILNSAFPPAFPPRSDRFPTTQEHSKVKKCVEYFQSNLEIDSKVRFHCATISGSVLTHDDGAKFALRDAVRFLGPSLSGPGKNSDIFGMTGRIVPLSELLASGATLSSSLVKIGSLEYEVQLGFLVQPLN